MLVLPPPQSAKTPRVKGSKFGSVTTDRIRSGKPGSTPATSASLPSTIRVLVDNGSIYCSQEITLICARVGCILRHTAVRDAAAKGKIERFFRRVRDQFLVQKLDLSSLAALKRLNPDDLRLFILRELDRVGLGHNTFTTPAVDLVVRSADGVLRKARNLCVGCMIEAVRSTNRTIDIDTVNRVLLQPHWQKESDLTDH